MHNYGVSGLSRDMILMTGTRWTQGQLGLHFSAFLRTIISQSHSSLPRNISSKDVRALVRGIQLRLASLYFESSSTGAVMHRLNACVSRHSCHHDLALPCANSCRKGLIHSIIGEGCAKKASLLLLFEERQSFQLHNVGEVGATMGDCMALRC